jgi:hypothetical protein
VSGTSKRSRCSSVTPRAVTIRSSGLGGQDPADFAAPSRNGSGLDGRQNRWKPLEHAGLDCDCGCPRAFPIALSMKEAQNQGHNDRADQAGDIDPAPHKRIQDDLAAPRLLRGVGLFRRWSRLRWTFLGHESASLTTGISNETRPVFMRSLGVRVF